MVQLDYMEQTGHGVPLIVSHYGREAFDITENFITVTIPLKKIRKTGMPAEETASLDDVDRKIVSLMKKNGNIRVNAISEQIGLGTTTVTKHIRRLKAMGVIGREGSKRNGRWVTVK